MRTKLPLIVGFGGYNAAGRSSGHRGYERMIYESLNTKSRADLVASLASLMGLSSDDEQGVLSGTLVRKIEDSVIATSAAPLAVNVDINGESKTPLHFDLSARQMPSVIPDAWQVQPLDEEGRKFRVIVDGPISARVDVGDELQVKAAGQLPSGFDPSAHYRSTHHPRGLQMSVLGASDALNSIGIGWEQIVSKVNPDAVSVYSSSVMCQLDSTGVGGMMNARILGKRATSKQLSLGFTSMPADFTNAYVLGSLGATGAVTGACATFLYNLRWAVEDIRRGRSRVAVVGCSEAPILPEVIDGFAAMSALATDADLAKLDGVGIPDYRRASRPFGENCGFTIAESSQYVVLMADDLAIEMGAEVYGAVPGVYVNADGFKKSISAPGAGNYLTMAKAVGLANTLLGEEAVRRRSFVQAHGSSTPANRTTETKIFDQVARAFGIESWPVTAVKAYVGHSLGPASGDQLACSLGVFAKGVLPGIKTIDKTAADIFGERLSISNKDHDLGTENVKVSFLNSKGFGGNNATATILSPVALAGYLDHHYGTKEMAAYQRKREATLEQRNSYLDSADAGKVNARYHFGTGMVDESKIVINSSSLSIPGYEQSVCLTDNEGIEGF